MQIIQFLVGASYAALHSFISYEIPVQVPTLQKAASAVTSAAAAAATAATTAGFGDLVKKLLFRAAGEEGLAENVPGASPSQPAQVHHSSSPDGPAKYHTEYRAIPCIDTQGQTLAIWLNVFYLTPLTFLFVRFFVKSYITRTIGKGAAEKRKAAEKAASDALKGTDRGLNGKANGHVNGAVIANGKH